MFAPFKQILKDSDIKTVHDSALRVLDEVGILCQHKKAAGLLADGGEARYEGGRLYFRPEAIEALFEEKKAEFARSEAEASAKPTEFSLGGHWNCLEYCDPDTNMPRPATVEEACDMARLSEALGADGGPIPVAPGKINPRLRTLECERIALVHTRKHGGWLTATDGEEIRILADMHKAAGRRYTLGLEGLITPLKLNPVVFDTYFAWRDDPDVDIGIMGGIPVAGSSAPLAFPSCLVLPLAEGLALDYIFKTLSAGSLRCFDMRLEPFDMRYTNLAFGTPEHCLIIQVMCELREGLFGIKPRHGTFRTNGKAVDAQTMLERTACFFFQAALGARKFGSVGQMSMDEVYSPVQAVLDREILEYGKRVFFGIGEDCWMREKDAVEIIREGVAENGFLLNDATVGMFRNFYGFGRLSEASNLNGWRNRGGRKMEDKAWDQAQTLIKSAGYRLDAQAEKDVNRIYSKGMEILK